MSPIALAVIFFTTLFTRVRLTHLQLYEYPDSFIAFGWFLSSIPIIIFVVFGKCRVNRMLSLDWNSEMHGTIWHNSMEWFINEMVH